MERNIYSWNDYRLYESMITFIDNDELSKLNDFAEQFITSRLTDKRNMYQVKKTINSFNYATRRLKNIVLIAFMKNVYLILSEKYSDKVSNFWPSSFALLFGNQTHGGGVVFYFSSLFQYTDENNVKKTIPGSISGRFSRFGDKIAIGVRNDKQWRLNLRNRDNLILKYEEIKRSIDTNSPTMFNQELPLKVAEHIISLQDKYLNEWVQKVIQCSDIVPAFETLDSYFSNAFNDIKGIVPGTKNSMEAVIKCLQKYASFEDGLRLFQYGKQKGIPLLSVPVIADAVRNQWPELFNELKKERGDDSWKDDLTADLGNIGF